MTIYFRVLRCNVHMDKISLHQKTFAANVSFVYFCNARECNRTGEIGQFWRCYTPFLVCCAGWTKHLAGLPRSVRGKYAEQPGLLSVNALKHTLNSGPVLHSKLKARRSVLTIRREAFFILHLCFIFFLFLRLLLSQSTRGRTGKCGRVSFISHFLYWNCSWGLN